MFGHLMWLCRIPRWILALLAGTAAIGVGLAGWSMVAPAAPPDLALAAPQPIDTYVVLAWNDLGMHCYNADFQYLAVLPPYNNLWAQVIRVGDPPQIVTDTTIVAVTYRVAGNTYSVGKSNFWDYDQALFGVDLLPNVGLTGKGLAGSMDAHGDHFVAEGIPLTEFRDSALTIPYPYQLAVVTVWDAQTGERLAETTTVAGVSTEMHCDYCHSDGQREGIATGSVEKNILTLHDRENMDEYPAGHRGSLVSRTPILCAECHASNALGKPGAGDVPSLSNAIHEAHAERVSANLNGCYQCHPGPQTQCLRDVMSQRGMDCVSCHGTMSQVASNNNPWLHEPRCDNSGCHPAYTQNAALYRMSTEHGGVYCEGCHDSTHAIAPSREPNDGEKFLAWQGHAGPIDTCTVCHAYAPAPPGTGPHGTAAQTVRDMTLGVDLAGIQPPGGVITYVHTLQNAGNLTDTYTVTWTTAQGWATVSLTQGGLAVSSPVVLSPGEKVSVQVVISVPNLITVLGWSETVTITATSQADPSLTRSTHDVTQVMWSGYLPLALYYR